MTRPLILVTPATTVIPDVHGADYAAVDAGLLTLTEQGINPVFACGDFDSPKTPLDPCDVPEGCRLLRFPAEKNESDSQLAVQEAIHLGYDPVILTGSLSGRIDHTLANIRLLTHHHPGLILTDKEQQIRLLPPGIHVVTREFQHISLFALELSCISLESMQYPLDHCMVDEADIYTLSNEVAENEEKGIIHVHSGRLLLVQSNLP